MYTFDAKISLIVPLFSILFSSKEAHGNKIFYESKHSQCYKKCQIKKSTKDNAIEGNLFWSFQAEWVKKKGKRIKNPCLGKMREDFLHSLRKRERSEIEMVQA